MIRKYNFDYSFISRQEVESELDQYFRTVLMNQAGKDNYLYLKLVNTDFESIE